MAPIAFSIFGDFDDCHDKHVPHLHTHHAPISYLIEINGDVHKKRYVMMDDAYLYHAHTFFLLCMMCVGVTPSESDLCKFEQNSPNPHRNDSKVPTRHFRAGGKRSNNITQQSSMGPT